jgi:hypothetical protein
MCRQIFPELIIDYKRTKIILFRITNKIFVMGLLPTRFFLSASSVFLIVIIFFTAGCAGDGSRQVRETVINIDISDEELKDLFRIKQVFYALPSPLETAILLKSAGASYSEELLNPVANVSRYLTNKSMSINLGIYTTNICYASLYNQTQTCLRYMDAAKTLADNLGIIDAIDNNTMERFERNIHDQEVIMDIVSETFMNSSSFLQENNREPVAAMMFVGGWVEGLYLALNLASENDLLNNRLVNRIIDSKLSFDIVMLLLEDYSYNQDVSELMVQFEEIGDIFRKIDIRSTRINVINTPDDPVAILSSENTSSIDRDVFRQLKLTVTDLRNGFVN